jgi:hypothetical protein
MKVKRYTSRATVSRRQFLFQALAGAAGIRAVALADDKPTAPGLSRDRFLPDELRAMEATAAAFMNKHVPVSVLTFDTLVPASRFQRVAVAALCGSRRLPLPRN